MVLACIDCLSLPSYFNMVLLNSDLSGRHCNEYICLNIDVSKDTKIRNRYIEVPQLTQSTFFFVDIV